MKLKIPYYPQKNDSLCGPASLQMVLSFFGQETAQKELARIVGLSKKKLKKFGTSNDKMIEMARTAKFYCYVNEGSTIKEIKYFIHLGLPVIVNYTEPSENIGHFAVVIGYSQLTKKVIMNDPLNGKNFKLPESQFLRRWQADFEDHRHWLMVLSKKPFKIGKQFFPKITRLELISSVKNPLEQ